MRHGLAETGRDVPPRATGLALVGRGTGRATTKRPPPSPLVARVLGLVVAGLVAAGLLEVRPRGAPLGGLGVVAAAEAGRRCARAARATPGATASKPSSARSPARPPPLLPRGSAEEGRGSMPAGASAGAAAPSVGRRHALKVVTPWRGANL